jgi:putative endonuclease
VRAYAAPRMALHLPPWSCPVKSSAPPKTWHVYLIECRDGSIYTGIAVDVAARYAAHAAGKGARYTRSRPPQRLLASFAMEDKSAALREELRIKRMTAAQKRSYALLGGAGSEV